MINTKGGAGKTNVATHLTLAAQQSRKYNPLLIDIDPAKTACSRLTSAGNPTRFTSCLLSDLQKSLKAAEKNGFDFIVIDTPSNDFRAATEAAELSTFTLVPMAASVDDITHLEANLKALQYAGKNTPEKHAFVLTRTHAPSLTAEVRDIILERGGRVCDTSIPMLKRYAEASSDPYVYYQNLFKELEG